MKDKTARIKKINYFWPISDLDSKIAMKLITTFFFFFSLFISNSTHAQFLIPGEGIMDVKIGADWDEVEWELGFKGNKLSRNQVGEDINKLADAAGIDFDFMVSYHHIMWLPVSELLFKDNKVCMIQLSSYPEYNQMISADIGTVEGLNFWDSTIEIQQVYGNYQSVPSGTKTIALISEKGLGVELSENEIRTMFIFQPQMK